MTQVFKANNIAIKTVELNHYKNKMKTIAREQTTPQTLTNLIINL